MTIPGRYWRRFAKPHWRARTNLLSLVIAAAGVVVPAQAALESRDASNDWLATRVRLDAFFNKEILGALMYPLVPATTVALSDIDTYLKEVRGPPAPPVLPPLLQADRLRWSAALALAKSRFLQLMASSRPDLASEPVRRELAGFAAADAEEGLRVVASLGLDQMAADDPQRLWVAQSRLLDLLSVFAAHGNAVLQENGDRDGEHAVIAGKHWGAVDASFRANYPPAFPEMNTILGLSTYQVTGQMTQVSWVGVGLLVLATILVLLVKRNSILQIADGNNAS